MDVGILLWPRCAFGTVELLVSPLQLGSSLRKLGSLFGPFVLRGPYYFGDPVEGSQGRERPKSRRSRLRAPLRPRFGFVDTPELKPFLTNDAGSPDISVVSPSIDSFPNKSSRLVP